jgi:anti-anti-sigma factor
MDIQISAYPHTRVIAIAGVIDSMTQEELAGWFTQQIEQGATNLVLDMSRVDFMSSAGLRLMLQVVKVLRGRGGDLRLAAAQPPVAKMLEVCGFDCLLEVFPSVEAAVDSFG